MSDFVPGDHDPYSTILDRAAIVRGDRITFVEFGDIELAESHRRPVRQIVSTPMPESEPRPAIVAHAGYNGSLTSSAYYFDGACYRHCETGEIWNGR